MIESYDFGKIIIDKTEYTSDLILLTGRIKTSWRREEGHRLSLKDLEDVFLEKIEALVIGTGFLGLMKVKEEVIEAARASSVEIFIENTKKAVVTYNRLSSLKKTAGAFHLTC